MKNSVVLAFISAIFLALLAMPASAQATRTWVSGTGDDANPCSRTAPCKTFAGAISKTAAAGEIDCLDPGGFGAVTITKSMSILCGPSTLGGVLVNGTNGVVVSAGATDKVYLQGLDFEGLNTSLSAVQVNSGLAVYIIQCTIRDFAQNGVNVVSSTANTRVVIQDSVIENNGTTGSNPANGGVNVQGNGVNNAASIFNTLVDGNKNFAVQVAAGNSIALVRSVLSGSPAGIAGAGTVVSFGPSNIITGTGAVTTTTNYK